MIKMLLLIAVVTMSVLAGGSSVGNLKNTRNERDYKAMSSGYWDTRNDSIVDDTIVIKTVFPGMMCISIKNESSGDMAIFYTTETQPDSVKVTYLSSYTHSGLMPSIYKILGTAAGSTTGKITLFFWNLTN